MSALELELGRLIAERYELLRVLNPEPEALALLVKDLDSGQRRQMRFAPEEVRSDEAIAARSCLGPYVLRVHALETLEITHEEEPASLPVLLVDHYSQSIELSTLAGTWRDLLVSVLGKIAEGLVALHAVERPLGVLTPTRVRIVSAKGGFIPILDDLAPWQPEEGDSDGVWVTGESALAAPESLEEGGEASCAGDIFSFGVLSAHAFTGCLPFGDEGVGAWMGRGPSVLARRPRVLSAESMELSALEPTLRKVVRACLALNPEDRPSALELVEALSSERAKALGTQRSAKKEEVSSASELSTAPERAPAEFVFDMSSVSGSPVDAPPRLDEDVSPVQAFTPRAEEAPPSLPVAQAGVGLALVLLLLVWWLFASGESEPKSVPAAPLKAQTTPSKAPADAALELSAREEPPEQEEAEVLEEALSFKLPDLNIHAALPALGCVGKARVYRAGPPVVLDLPCHMRCILSLDDEGMPERIIRCRGDDARMSGEGPALQCTGSERGGELRCTAEMMLLMGESEKGLSDTLTLRIKR